MTHTRCLDARDFAVPADDRYFEDYRAGDVHHYGTVVMTEEDIIDFARRFDPQAMHTDVEAAANGFTQGLIASGMHTASLCVRLLVDHYLSKVATLPSPAIKDLRFPVAVRPGDELSLRTETTQARLSRSDPGRGVVTTVGSMLNQDAVIVAEMVFVHLFRRRALP